LKKRGCEVDKMFGDKYGNKKTFSLMNHEDFNPYTYNRIVCLHAKDGRKAFVYDKNGYLCYGTTNLIHSLEVTKRLLRQSDYISDFDTIHKHFHGATVIFCGIILEMKMEGNSFCFVDKDGNKYTDSILFHLEFMWYKLFITPKIKYSFELRDIRKYKTKNIIISEKESVYCFDEVPLLGVNGKPSKKNPQHIRTILANNPIELI
jgi:hypothetical protein